MTLYSGPCLECCDCTQVAAGFAARYPNLTLTVSGGVLCEASPVCGIALGGDLQIAYSNINGIFFLVNAGTGHWTFTVPNGVTVTKFSSIDGSCNGAVISTVLSDYFYDVELSCDSTLTGFILSWNLNITSDFLPATLMFDGGAFSPLNQTIVNIRDCPTSGAPASGGQATLAL